MRGEALAVVTALAMARGWDWWMNRCQRRREQAAGRRVVQDGAGPAVPATAMVRCAIHGDFDAVVSTIVVDLEPRPRIAHIPCPDCREAREVPVAPAVAVWLVERGALRADEISALADVTDVADLLRRGATR